MRYFVTKHCLARGEVEEAELRAFGDDPRYLHLATKGSSTQSFRLGRDAFATRAEAVADAKNRVRKKVASLRKQITKLEQLEFTE